MDEKRFHFEKLFLLNLIDTPFPSNLASIRSCLNSKKWDGRRHDRWGTNDFLGLTAWCGKDVQLKAMAQFEALFFFKNCRFLSLHKHCHLWALASSKLCINSALHSSKAGDLFFHFSLSLSLPLSLSYTRLGFQWSSRQFITSKVYYVNILSRQINVMSESDC